MSETPPTHGYPRPMFRRDRWLSLNGHWQFAIDVEGRIEQPRDVTWDRRIRVPFSPETIDSGVGEMGFYRVCWYRRTVGVEKRAPGERVILHFGAVDYSCNVWVEGVHCGAHEGGYTPFSMDITPFLKRDDGEVQAEIVVRAEDDPHDLAKPRGKQDWQLEPHSIWYPRTSGIWQTVWLEIVPAVSLRSCRWTPSLDRWEIGFETELDGIPSSDLRVRVRLSTHQRLLVDDMFGVKSGEVSRRIGLSDPGIDDSRNELLWSPESPTLIGAELQLLDDKDQCIDRVHSYTALRSVSVQGERVVLNGRPYDLRLVLDQGYWRPSGMTAPDDAALRKDVELAKAMGFNGVRKHQKLEDPRYLHWADRLGLLVWEEMPSAYRFTRKSIERLTREWPQAIERDYSHPCIMAWVPFNESWGVPNLPDSPAERHWVQALYHLTKTLDPSRPVIGNDGWESVDTDIMGIHDYDDNPSRIAQRYHSPEDRPRLFRHARPGGRLLVLGEDSHLEHPVVLSEFGGIACASNARTTWGYARRDNPADLARAYTDLLETVRSLDLLAGFCYTQFVDTYQEANGLLYEDRTPKFPLAEIAAATRGRRQK